MAHKKVYDADEYGYQKDNPRHQESYWQDRSDPRDRSDDDKFMMFNSNYYKVVDRQLAADHHERTQGAAGQQPQSGGAGGSSGNGNKGGIGGGGGAGGKQGK